MAASEGLTTAIDQVIAHFNARKMDLPDGFFDRRRQLRDTGEPLNAMIDVTLKLAPSGSVETAAATMDELTLEKIRQARRS